MEATKSPYEDYLKLSISLERERLDSLYVEFAKSDPIRKRLLKRRIEEALQNIQLLQKDLDKYMNGLSWLREPSKERDEKAEHLPKLEKEATAPAPSGNPPAKPGQAATKPVVARPTIGKPIGAPGATSPPVASRPVATPAPALAARPTIGTPVGTPAAARPRIGTPVGQPTQTQPQGDQKPPASQPAVGTPVKRPVIGTPIGKPKPAQDSRQQNSGSSTTDGSTS